MENIYILGGIYKTQLKVAKKFSLGWLKNALIFGIIMNIVCLDLLKLFR